MQQTDSENSKYINLSKEFLTKYDICMQYFFDTVRLDQRLRNPSLALLNIVFRLDLWSILMNIIFEYFDVLVSKCFILLFCII